MRKDEGGKEIIIEVGLAVVGVALLLVFKKQISEIVSGILDTASTKIDALFTTAASNA